MAARQTAPPKGPCDAAPATITGGHQTPQAMQWSNSYPEGTLMTDRSANSQVAAAPPQPTETPNPPTPRPAMPPHAMPPQADGSRTNVQQHDVTLSPTIHPSEPVPAGTVPSIPLSVLLKPPSQKSYVSTPISNTSTHMNTSTPLYPTTKIGCTPPLSGYRELTQLNMSNAYAQPTALNGHMLKTSMMMGQQQGSYSPYHPRMVMMDAKRRYDSMNDPRTARYGLVDNQWVALSDEELSRELRRWDARNRKVSQMSRTSMSRSQWGGEMPQYSQNPQFVMKTPLPPTPLKTEPGKGRLTTQMNLPLDHQRGQYLVNYQDLLAGNVSRDILRVRGFDDGMARGYDHMTPYVYPAHVGRARYPDGYNATASMRHHPMHKKNKRAKLSETMGQVHHQKQGGQVPPLVTSDEESRSLTRSASPQQRPLKSDPTDGSAMMGRMRMEGMHGMGQMSGMGMQMGMQGMPGSPSGLTQRRHMTQRERERSFARRSVKPETLRPRPDWKPYDLFVQSSLSRKSKTLTEKCARGKTKTGWRHWTQPENVKLWELTAEYRSKRRYVQWKEVQRQYNLWTVANDYPNRSSKSLTTHYNDQLKKRKYRDRRGINQP